ncbi:hypothetical protein LCGC14_0641810 [marine sediment metagenome]|uniref:Uncharacterized protein n=1 Tax=marine sediment metagenome TaxID=412755 RepID=A0A0F9U7D4_9ZZZZ
MNDPKFKSLKEIDKILKSKEFKKQADLIEKQNKELLASTKIDRNKLNISFDI